MRRLVECSVSMYHSQRDTAKRRGISEMETEQTWRGRMGVGQCSKSAVGCEQMFSGAR